MEPLYRIGREEKHGSVIWVSHSPIFNIYMQGRTPNEAFDAIIDAVKAYRKVMAERQGTSNEPLVSDKEARSFGLDSMYHNGKVLTRAEAVTIMNGFDFIAK